MSRCKVCHQDGVLFVEHEAPDGYVVLACTCPRGDRWRTPYQLRALAARMMPPPLWVGRLEEFFTEAERATLQPREATHPIVDGKEQVRR